MKDDILRREQPSVGLDGSLDGLYRDQGRVGIQFANTGPKR